MIKQELRVPGVIMWSSHGDLDGDGLVDLVISYRRGAGPAAQRFMAVFFRDKDRGYSQKPTAAFAAPKVAVAFDLGDAVGDAKDEIVYLSSDGVYAQRFEGRQPKAPEKIVSTRTLGGRAEEEDLISWDILTAPTKADPATLIVPKNGPLKLYRRGEGDRWDLWSTVMIGALSFYDAAVPTFRRSRRGGSNGAPYAFAVTTIIPTLRFVDQTGDKKTDLVTLYEDRVQVYPAQADGTLRPRPSFRRWLQLRTPEEEATRDNEVILEVDDLDGDGIADLSATKIGGGVTTLKTETRLYRGTKGGGFDKEPAQTWKESGFASLVQFVDVDGDGRKDMVQPSAEVSILSMSKALLSSELTLGLRIRKPTKEGGLFFETSPTQVLDTVFALDFKVGGALRGNRPIFGYDFDGDGKRDAVLAKGADGMGVHHGIADSDELLEDDARIQLSAAPTRQTLVLPKLKTPEVKPDLLLMYTDYPDKTGHIVVFLND